MRPRLQGGGRGVSDEAIERSWNQYSLAALALFTADHNPEETLQVALTLREFNAVTFGLILLCRLFPETRGVFYDLIRKLDELNSVQGLFPHDDEFDWDAEDEDAE
jgi:hypothetical protein